MQLSAVILARAIGLFDINELDPTGGIFLPDLVPLLVERFRFQVFPQKTEDFDLGKGIAFGMGSYGGQTVNNLTIYRDGVKVDTRNSTEQGKQIIVETLDWLSKEHGLFFKQNVISRWSYLSNISFQSDWALDFLSPPVQRLCERLSELLEETSESKQYHLTALSFDFERVRSSMSVSPFTIERRGKALFSENKYFSASPLSTSVHIRLLQDFEADVAKSAR